jgi:hypothetical protein
MAGGRLDGGVESGRGLGGEPVARVHHGGLGGPLATWASRWMID